MFRKKSRSAPSSTPVVYRQLSARLEEVEQLLDELAADSERLQRQNQALKIEVRRLSLQLSEAHEARPVVPNQLLVHNKSSLPAEIDLDEPQPSTDGPGPVFWVLTLLIAAAAGFSTFYLVRPLGGPL